MAKCYISYWHHGHVLYFQLCHGQALWLAWTSWQVLNITLISWASAIFNIDIVDKFCISHWHPEQALFYSVPWASTLYHIDIMGKCYISHCDMYKCYKPHSNYGLVLYFTLCPRHVKLLTSTSWIPHCVKGKCYISEWHHWRVLYFKSTSWASVIFQMPHGLVLNFILQS
jgi:hypothetical protein